MGGIGWAFQRAALALLVAALLITTTGPPVLANETQWHYGGDKYAALKVKMEYSPSKASWTLRRINEVGYGGSLGGSPAADEWKALNRYHYYKPQDGSITYAYRNNNLSVAKTNFNCNSSNGTGCVYHTGVGDTLWQGHSLSTLLKAVVKTRVYCDAPCTDFDTAKSLSWYGGPWN